MDFFEAQAAARRRTRWLLLAFAAAAVFVVLSFCAIAILAYAALAMFAGLPLRSDVPPGGFFGTYLAIVARVPHEVPLFVGGVLAAIIAAVTAGRMWQLREGGFAVAHLLGARYVDPANCNATERRLLNVVEEMAIASGIACPPVYLLDRERAVNSLVAGHTPNEAVLVVTQGALSQLTRDELQGVIGHEFSHIFNGDMALNIRLAAILSGLTWIGDESEKLFERSMQSARALGREKTGGDALMAVAAALLAMVGFPGTLAADAIKASISRSREHLADAASVQFTRNPEGIAGALDSVAVLKTGTHVNAAYAAGFAHMFFAQAVSHWWNFPTHPPMAERIRRTCPQFQRLDYRKRRGTATAPADRAVAVLDGGGNVVQVHDPLEAFRGGAGAGMAIPAAALAGAVAASVGRPAAADMDYARRLLAAIPPALRERMATPEGAAQLLFALAFESDEETRAREAAALAGLRGEAYAAAAVAAHAQVARLGRASELSLAELALPVMRARKQPERDAFLADHRAVVEADGRVTLREFVLHAFLRQHLREDAGRPVRSQYRSVAEVKADAHAVLSMLALAGGAAKAPAAFEAGKRWLGVELAAPLPAAQLSMRGVGESLERLRHLQALEKPRIIKACTDAVNADGAPRLAELDLLRLVAATLDCPLPPAIASLDPARLAA